MSDVGIEFPPWALQAVMLVAQATLAVLTIELLRTRVFPVVHRLDTPELVLDVWTPLAVVLPMFFFAGRMTDDVQYEGWVVIGGPITCAILAAGAAVALGVAVTSVPVRNWTRLTIASGGTSSILLMLAAAHDLTLWVGQCAFAVGAVLLWMNTPEWHRNDRENGIAVRLPGREERTAGAAMTIALGCALAQGLLVLYMESKFARVGAAVLMAQGSMLVMLAARLAGASSALRIGGWAAVYGVLLGLGVFAMVDMAPQAWRILTEGEAERISKVANGFGAFAFEACMLAVFAAGSALLIWRPLRAHRVIGLAVIAHAAMIAAYRIARMSM